MTRQKSDDRVVPQGRRKAVQTREIGGGKAITVNEEPAQFVLPFATAAHRPSGRLEGRQAADPSAVVSARSKADVMTGNGSDATIEKVTEGLERAFGLVAANKGAPAQMG